MTDRAAAGAARAALVLAALVGGLALAPDRPTPSGVDSTRQDGAARLLSGRGIDPNRAGRATLELLPRIGPGRAAAWVEEREQGPFCGPRDLERVKGIGPATIRDLEGWLSFEPTPGCGMGQEFPIDL